MNATSNRDQIQEHMEVVCSRSMHVGKVDHVEGDHIKLAKSDSPDGRHHTIPLGMVSHVDDKIHLNLPCDQVKNQWRSVE